ncbi:hypothetical protein KAI58_04745 [Candidatus Gracilibacteria bacterium]|nr:hypothetical protein [Candidatus Gracilibacteria bacterium]
MNQQKFTSDATLFTIFLRFISGFGAGLAGTIVLGIILFFTWSMIGETITQSNVSRNEFGVDLSMQTVHPLFLGIVLIAVFLASLISNLIYCTIASTLEEKYYMKSTNLTHVFFGNLSILVFFLPVYLVASNTHGPAGIAIASLTHVILTAIFTFFILEILSTSSYILVSLYGIIIGLILFFFFGIIFSNGKTIILSFIVLPLILSSLATGNGIAEMFYLWAEKTYGNDFLDSKKRFGKDYGRKDKTIDPSYENL